MTTSLSVHFFKNKNFDLIIPANLQANLSSKMLETVKKEAQNLAQGFLNSDLGKKALKSSWCKSEYDFKMSVNINNQIYIIDGQIDLIFKDEETAIDAGYRPCGICMKKEYKKWKENSK